MLRRRSLSYWILWAYYAPSILIMWTERDTAGAAVGWSALGGSVLATFAGACLKKAMLVRSDRRQSIGVAVVGLCLLFFAFWLAENYSAPLLGYVTVPGWAWSLLGFVLALVVSPSGVAARRPPAR
jgi:hypothetical protein